MNNKYDVIIYGGRLSGLLTAALLKDRGVDVLLLSNENISELSEKNYKLDLQMLPLGNLPDSPVVTNVLGRLGLGFSNKEFFCPAKYLFQIITDSHRIDISGNKDELLDEIEREFSGDRETFSSIVEETIRKRDEISHGDYDLESLYATKGLKSNLADIVKGGGKTFQLSGESLENKLGTTEISGQLKKIISLCLTYATPLCPSSGKLPFLPLPFDSKTSYYPKGGMSGFKKLIEKRLEERGVHIERGRRLEEIVIQKKCVTKIKFEDDENRVSAKAMIFNAIPAILPSLLPQSFFTKKFRRKLSAEVRWGRWQTIFIGIESEKIPIGMDDNLVVDIDEKFPLLFQIVPEEDEGITPQKKRLLKVSWPVEEGEKAEDDAKDFDEFEKKVLKKIEELMPFIDDKFEIIYRHDSEPASSEDYILSGALQTPPGIGVLSPLTPYKNLVVSGREMMPVLGVEGEFRFAEIISNYIYKIISEPEK